MDRRGFLRNILGSLAAIACPSIRAAKPLETKNLQVIEFGELRPDGTWDITPIAYDPANPFQRQDVWMTMNEARETLA